MDKVQHALFLAAAAAVAFFFGIQSRLIMESSEGRIARVAQEMIDRDEWVVPTLNGAIRKEKPPLNSWVVAAVTLASGSREVTAAHAFFPSAVFGIALVLLAFAWLKTNRASTTLAEGEKPSGLAPFLAGLILITAPGFLLQARSAELDILLALLVSLAFYGFWNWRAKASASGLVLCYIALAISVLTKGHVGLVIFLPAVLLWSLLEHSHFAMPTRTRVAWPWHVLGFILLLLIVLPWGIAFIQQSGITWADFNKEGGVARFGKKTGHQEPFFFYLANIPGWVLPWTLPFVFALFFTRDLPPDERSPLRRFLWCWLGWGTFLFSLLTAKQRHYAVPFMVPLALLMADAIERWWQHPSEKSRQAARKFIAGFAVLLALTLVGFFFYLRQGEYYEELARGWNLHHYVVVGAIILLMAAVLAYQNKPWVTRFTAGLLCLVALYAAHRDVDDHHDSPIAFIQKVRAEVPKDQPLYDYNVAFANNVWRAQVLFYMGRNLERREEPLAEFGKTPGRYILANDKWLEQLPKENYDILVEDHAFLGHRRDAYLIRTK